MRQNIHVRKYLATTALTSTAIPVLLAGALASLADTATAQELMSGSPRQIPLEYVYHPDLDTNNNPIVNPDGSQSMYFNRLGIWVGIGDGQAQRFLFDTGSDQLNAAIGNDANVNDSPGSETKFYGYNDGTNGYTYKAVSFNKLTYYNRGGTQKLIALDGDYQAAKILDTVFTTDSPELNNERLSPEAVCITSMAGDGKCYRPGELDKDDVAFEFHSDLDAHPKIEAGQRFEEGDTLAGTFGAGDYLFSSSIQSSALPGMTQSGFIVAANGNSDYAENGASPATPGCSPCVLVDLNAHLRAQFTSVMPWFDRDRDGHVDTFPGSGAPASTEFESGYTLKFNEGKETLALDLPVLLDTGTPGDGSIKLGGETFDVLQKRGIITVSEKNKPDDPDAFEMSLSIEGLDGTPVQLDKVVVTRDETQAEGKIEFIAGLNFFLSQSVAYDLEKKSTAYTPYFVSADNFTTDQGSLSLPRITKKMGSERTLSPLDDHGNPLVGHDGKPLSAAYGALGIAGVVSGPGSLSLDAFTDVRMTNVNTYTGATNISKNAFLTLAGLGSIEQSEKVVADGFLDISERGDGNEYWGLEGASRDVRIRSLAGSGQVALGDRTLVLTAANDAFSGVINDWDPKTDKSMGGKLSVVGGVQTLSGESIYTGMTTVRKGAVLLLADTGALASPVSVSGLFGNDGKVAGATAVLDGGIAAGTGHYNSLTIGKGGKVTPGSLLDPGTESSTLTVDGDFVQQAGSVYLTSFGSNGNADSITVRGKATIDGGASVDLVRENAGGLSVGMQYTILTAYGGVQGVYGALTGDLYADSPFVDFALDHQSNAVYLDVERNTVAFADVGNNFNQKSTAAAVESIGPDSSVYDAILFASETGSRNAFDQLSGEIHASIGGALVEESHFVRDAATDRIRSAFEGVGASNVPISAYGPDGLETVSAASDGAAFWGRGFGAWGHINGDGNASRLDRSTGGFLAGVDTPLAQTWRLGLIAGYSHSSFDVDERLSSGSSDNFHLGAYGGSQWGNLGFRSGLAYSWHSVDTRRNVHFSGFADSLTSDYDAGTFQAFGEFGYRIDAGPASFEPYANLAYVYLKTNGFSENGGGAALSGASRSQDVTFSTLGLRGSTNIQLGSISAVARGGIGWRHAFGDVMPLATMAFSSGAAFDARGTPIAENAALVEAGIDMKLTERAMLGVSYQGQIASDAQEHGFNAKLNVRF